MIAVIKGDIINSRLIINQDKWLIPLEDLLNEWGKSPEIWEVAWGDSFQLEVENPAESLYKALLIKALIKGISFKKNSEKMSEIDVRISIGIGEKTYAGRRVSESNGPAYIYAGEKFSLLKKENTTLAIKSKWPEFDEEFNLYLKLAGVFMDKWTKSSAELVGIVLKNSMITQEEVGKLIGIKQSGVSGRWNRAKIDEILEIDNLFRRKIKQLL
jgi:hypothetical protein